MNVKNYLHTFVWPGLKFSWQRCFMNGAKICQQQIWGSRNYQISHILFPRPWPVRFNSSDIYRPVSTQDFEFITKLNEQSSTFEFVKRPVESSLSVCSMLKRASRTSWEGQDYRLLQVLYCMPNDLVSVFYIFFNEKLYRFHKS